MAQEEKEVEGRQMPNDRIRQKLKAAGKSLRDIVRERNEAMAAYGYILAHIEKNVGLRTMYKLRDQYEKRARKYAAEHQDDLLQRGWKK